LAHYTKRFIPEFDAECRIQPINKFIFLAIMMKILGENNVAVVLVSNNEKK